MFAIAIAAVAAIAAIAAVIFAAIVFTMASSVMCLDILAWDFLPNNSLDPAGRVHMFHLHPSNVLSEILAWCCHPVVSGAMFGANGELLSKHDESVFQGFRLGSFLTTPSVSHETLSAILAKDMRQGRRLNVHWQGNKKLYVNTFATVRVVVDIFRVGNAEEVSDEQEDFIAHYQQLGQVLDHLPGIVTGVLFVPNGNEEDRKSAWRAVRRSEKVSYGMRDSAEIAFERLVRVYDDFKERYPHAFQDTSEYEKELNAIKSFTGVAFGALGSDVFHMEMRLRCDLMSNRGLTAPSRKRALSEEPELEEEQQPPVKKMRYSQVAVAAAAVPSRKRGLPEDEETGLEEQPPVKKMRYSQVAVAVAAAPSRKRGLPEDEETGLDEQPQVKKSRSNSSAIPPKKRTQFSPLGGDWNNDDDSTYEPGDNDDDSSDGDHEPDGNISNLDNGAEIVDLT